MANRFLQRSVIRFWIIPTLFFVVTVQDAWLSHIAKIPTGLITTLVEVGFSIFIAWCAKESLEVGYRKYMAVPILIAGSDLLYGLGNYVFKLPLPNNYACLTYVIPSVAAFCLLIHGLYRLARNEGVETRRLLSLALVISLAVFSLTAVNIITPALYQKQPVLPPLLQALTIIYSVLESTVVGFTAALLLCANMGALQLALFGTLFMHLSDMAIRYQSVKLELMGFTVFEYGWCFGIMLGTVASARYLSWKREAPIRNVPTWVPLSSIRGMTIAFVMTGFVILWGGFSVYFHTLSSAIYSSSTLLILAMMFAFAIVVADITTRQVQRAVLSIRNREEFDAGLAAPFVPQEIKIITSHFQKLTEEIAAEKDHVLNLTSTVSHDLRGPIRSLQRTTEFLKESIGENCENRDQILEHVATIEDCATIMRKTVNDLLRSRKEVVEGDPIGEAVQKAAKLVQVAHAESKILVDAPSDVSGPRIHGLTRVLSNLLDNAVEASPKDSPVQLQVTREKGRGYHIVIRDRGAGIPKQVLERIEAGESVSTKADGNGLGLSFMKSWAKRRDIKYHINTALGHGTEVALHITADK